MAHFNCNVHLRLTLEVLENDSWRVFSCGQGEYYSLVVDIVMSPCKGCATQCTNSSPTQIQPTMVKLDISFKINTNCVTSCATSDYESTAASGSHTRHAHPKPSCALRQ